MSIEIPLNSAQIKLLSEYAHTSDSHFTQGLPGIAELCRRELLQWRGEQYGCHFYSITEKGLRVLEESKKDDHTA